MLKRIDHVAVVVDNLLDAQRLLEGMGLRLDHIVDLPGRLTAAQYRCGDACIELIEVREPVERARRLGNLTARLEHVAIEVDDIEDTVAMLTGLGVKTQNEKAIAVDNALNHWTSAESSDGIVYQFLQKAQT